MNYFLSLIIPVYKTEKFIEKCLVSVCKQTLTDFEIIIINDASPDKSIEIIKNILINYPDKSKHTKIVSFEENKGIAYVRKYALSIASGEYIASLDSDDYLEINALKDMLNAARQYSVDIVFCDYYFSTLTEDILINEPPGKNKYETIEFLLLARIHGSLCNKLFKKDLLNKVVILENINMSEDLLIVIQAIYFSNSYVYIPHAYLHYVNYNVDSITSIYSEKKIKDMIYGIDFIEFFLNEKFSNQIVGSALLSRKAMIKSDALTHSNKKARSLYYGLFNLEFGKIYNLNGLNFYKKIILFFCEIRMFFIVDLLITLRSFLKKIR